MMDLEEFELDEHLVNAKPAKLLTASKALQHLDANWYTRVTRRGRWMDLIGDYAGSEPFIIDGESLIQIVLDDPLLAIGRPNAQGFQILHALHSVERILNNFKTCSAVFEVVFWDDARHLTLSTGGTPDVFTARTFARRIIFNHLLRLDIPVHIFTGMADPSWIEHQKHTKPMFIMLNDGGPLIVQGDLSAERILTQRVFLLEILSSGVSVSLLNGAEFRDSKILSFVYEQKINDNSELLTASMRSAISVAREALNLQETNSRQQIQISPLSPAVTPTSGDQWLIDTSRLVSARLSSPVDLSLLFLFIAHSLLLEDIPLEDRARPLERLHKDLNDHICKTFLPTVFLAGESTSTNLVPHIDGRVFTSLVRCIIANKDKIMEVVIGARTYQRASSIWSSIPLSCPDLIKFAARYQSLPCQEQLDTSGTEPLPLLAFSSDIFDAELSSISVVTDSLSQEETDPPSSHAHLEFGHVFSDTQHWHNVKKAILPSYLGGKSEQPLTAWQRSRALRREQRFMANMQRQAETLMGTFGAILKQIVILPAGSQAANNAKGRPAHAHSQKPNKVKAGTLSSKQKLLQNIAKQKQLSHEDTLLKWWCDHIEKMKKMDVSSQINHLQGLERNDKFDDPFLAAEVRLYKLNLQVLRWIDDRDRETDAVRDQYTVEIIRLVKSITDQKTVTPTVSTVLSSVLTAIGFDDYTSIAAPSVGEIPDRPLSFQFTKLLKSKTRSPYHKFFRIAEHPIIWQLRLFGQFMDRSMDSQPDSRVTFEPDSWQVKVLDVIDKNGSLLVVAPTSAGKTFISFYAMEKVLRGSDNGILVYIAPTKALVTQIAAEIYARFSKTLDGRSCWAVHTRDYRIHDPQKCQILVTVPEMLATMLLSPAMARVWTSRIKRIILDEIHSIGQQEGGAVWEQIILLAPCPIIGLSATIGSPEVFNDWLKSVQESHGYEHTFISHPHRYSHLRKHYYALQMKHKLFSGLHTHQSTDRVRFLHPIAMLSFGGRSLPLDLALEASDTLQLYKALVAHQDKINTNLDCLEPRRFFPTSSFLRQKDIIRYEVALKDVVTELAARHDSQDAVSPLTCVISTLADTVIARIPRASLEAAPMRQTFRSNLIYLLSDLHVSGNLPAILFNFDRTECEIMAQDVTEALERAEQQWRDTNPEWKRKILQFQDWQQRSKDRERQAERAKKQKKDPDEPSIKDISWESSFNPDDPSPQFSFAGGRNLYSRENMEEDVRGILRWVPRWAIAALRRGVAVHHAGMNKGYRTLVESLFRQGFVRVVIATGTLALGINAPTKTSVFCGDSPYLTALTYRQCAGRAGRRGYDLLGNVVFYGLSMDRVQRLILSKLPTLGGNFPLTSTLTLRLFNLLDGSQFAPVAEKAIKSLLRLPHLSFGSQTGRDQLLHHLRFSIDYLRRARLLDQYGKPMNLFTVANHLYYTEPSNFAMVVLMRQGILHKIAADPSTINARREFVLLMAHLFGRRYLSKIYTTKENLEVIVGRSPSMVLLPPLRKDACKALWEHDREILRIFTGYALTFASQHASNLGRDCCLPLSKQEYRSRSQAQSPDDNSIFRKHLHATAIPLTARSVFVANSGHGDHFKSVEELARTARHGLHLNEHAIPSMSHLTPASAAVEAPVALNAYLLDFYIHGQVKALAAANGIRRGDVWYALQDFVLCLKTVRGALEQLLLEASREAIEGREEDGKEEEEEEEEEEDNERPSFARPAGVSDLDWRVYEMIDGATEEYDKKFRAMWA